MQYRIRAFSFFSFADLCRLIIGKISRRWRGRSFDVLQDKENKLQLIGSVTGLRIDEGFVEFGKVLERDTFRFRLRLAGSDILVYNQVINNREYGELIDLFLRHFGKLPNTIIDAGANVGLTSIYFKSRNPHAHVLAIEPQLENFLVARKNFECNDLRSVQVIQAALWPTASQKMAIKNDFRDQSAWSLTVQPDSDGEVESISPVEALNFFQGPVDLFKIDIEGSEGVLFSAAADTTWMSRVKAIAVEIHHEIVEGELITKTMISKDFRIIEVGELTIGLNTKLLKRD